MNARDPGATPEPSPLIYLDHAATTPVDSDVLDAMRPYFNSVYGNPSSVHQFGQLARSAVDQARGTVAGLLNCAPREVIFTGGATESNNIALRGVARHYRRTGNRGGHLITSAIEHPAVLNVVEDLREDGFDATVVPVDTNGIVDPADVEASIRPDTILISVMYANNEIGTIQSVAEIGSIARRHRIPFHTDGVQAANDLTLDVEQLQVDLMSLSAHKFYAPKGAGLLYVRSGTRLDWLQKGGGQEYARRAGTENVPGIVGLAAGLQAAVTNRTERSGHVLSLRNRLIEGVLEQVPDSRLNGDPRQRLPGNAHISFEGVDGESLLLDLDLNGIAVSSGSACASGSNRPSHVLLATGLSEALTEGSLRITIGKDNTAAEIDHTVETIASAVSRIRSITAAVR